MRVLDAASGLIAGSIGRLLFPPICPGCQAAVSVASAVCAKCWAGLGFIERPYCEVLGSPFPYDPGPGALSAEAMANPPPFARLRAALLYRDLAARLVSRLKYSDRTDLAPMMAGWMSRAGGELLHEAAVVVPVPLHPGRLLRRRFNQSAELARHLARERRLPFAPLALVRIKATRSQVGLDPTKRRENVRGAFQVPDGHRSEIEARRVLLVDDVFTTGATVSSATVALKRAGAADVDVLTFARVASGDH